MKFVTERKYYKKGQQLLTQSYQSRFCHKSCFVQSVTSVSVDEIRSNHAKYVDDSGMWSNNESIKVALEVVNQELVTEKN